MTEPFPRHIRNRLFIALFTSITIAWLTLGCSSKKEQVVNYSQEIARLEKKIAELSAKNIVLEDKVNSLALRDNDIIGIAYKNQLSIESIQAQKRNASIRPGAKYRIAPGDTLSEIAQKAYGDASMFRLLARQNNIPDPDLIYAGQWMRIPLVNIAEFDQSP